MRLKAEEVQEPAGEVKPAEEPLAQSEPAPAIVSPAEEEPMAETPNPETQEQSTPIDSGLFLDDKKKGSKKGLFLVVILIALTVALVSGGIMVYRRTMSSQVAISSPELEDQLLEEEALPEATPTPELDRSELTVQVLNGSGTPGFAGEAKGYLEGLGYEEVDTGNADSYDYEESVIAIKESKKEYLSMLKADLVEKYLVAAKTETLDEDDDFDVIITLGSDEASGTIEEETEEEVVATPTSKKETETPTPTPEEEQ